MRHISSLALLACVACGSQVSSEEEAELAYLGLDGAIGRAMDLGFQGFNAADSANIDAQTGEGDESGTMTITGQIDQGASNNKGMRLFVGLEDYQDLVDLDDDESAEVVVTYWTDPEGEAPSFDLQLRGIPDGTLSGTLSGAFRMEGDLEGEVTIDVDIDGELQPAGDGTERVPGTTSVIGTATGPGGGTFAIDLTL
jgi:hypothetical protein